MDKATTASLVTPCYEAITACRSCGSTIFSNVLDLGMQALPDFTQTAPNWEYAPLELVQCATCQLVQLRHTVIRDRLFRTYFYRSGISETMRVALKDIAESIQKARGGFTDTDRVLDIGANDGTLLSYFPGERLGFEPAWNIHAAGVPIVPDYFTSERLRQAWRHGKADIITSIAMFYSVPNPVGFVADVAEVLASDGLWVIQMNDLQAMVEQNGFDIIGHEHVAVWSLRTLQQVLSTALLEVFRVERNIVNGGSCRVYIRHQGCTRYEEDAASLIQQLALEDHLDFSAFALRVKELCESLVMELSHAKRDRKKVYLYAAPTRGCTVLQTAKIGSELIAGAAERDERKWGKLVPGTSIPIVSEAAMREAKPDYLLTMSPYYLPQFMAREHEFLAQGGEFLVVFPSPHKVGAG